MWLCAIYYANYHSGRAGVGGAKDPLLSKAHNPAWDKYALERAYYLSTGFGPASNYPYDLWAVRDLTL